MTQTAQRRIPTIFLGLAVLVVGALAYFLGATPAARAASIGTLTLNPTSGSVTTQIPITEVTSSAPCPTDYAKRAIFKIVKSDGTEASLSSLTTIADGTQPVTLHPSLTLSLEQALGAPVADGDYEVRVKCFVNLSSSSPDYFSATIMVTGDTWAVKDTSAAEATTTSLTVTPAGTAAAGTEVKLAAAVTPTAAAGNIAFFDGTTKLGEAAAASGSAELKTTTLAVGTHSLTAQFTPTDAAAYQSSASAALNYPITAATTSPTNTTSPSASETADLEVTDEDGTSLGENPVLEAGQTVLITARGYSPGATVQVTLADSEETFADAAANDNGTVEKYEFTVPEAIADGSYTLTLAEKAGEGDGHSVDFAFTVGEPSASPTDSPTASDDTGANTTTNGSGSGSGSTNGGLAGTGSGAMLPISLAAIALTGLGVGFVRYGRRAGLLTFGRRLS